MFAFPFGKIGVGMNRAVLSVVCVTIILAIYGSGCIAPPDETNSYSYSIKIVAHQPLDYTIYAPFAYKYGSDNIMGKILLNARIIEGAGDISEIQTEYGLALKIDSNNTIYLTAEYQDTDDYHPLCLSMRSKKITNVTMEHWIFCEAGQQTEFDVNITLEARAGTCCGEVRTEQTKPGLQTISGVGWQKITTLFTVLG
jgi:hypothetical protein